MATGTAVTIRENTYQFRGIFEYVWVVRFNLDTASVAGGDSNEDTVAVPGLNPATDVVLGFTEDVEIDHLLSRRIYVTANRLDITTHNSKGTGLDPAASNFVVVIGRVAPGA